MPDPNGVTPALEIVAVCPLCGSGEAARIAGGRDRVHGLPGQFGFVRCSGCSLVRLSPRTNVPVRAILAQAAWASILALSGTYDTLTDSVIFSSWLFYGLMTAALFVFRKKMPDAPRPYRAFGYPLIPMIFLLVTAALLVNTFVAAPREALRGVAVLAAGLPFYWYWARRPSAAETARP